MTAHMDRRYDIDWLRVIGMMAVFFLHSTRFFDTIDWHVKNTHTYMGVNVILLLFHTWIMPFFFLISGAASWFYLQKHSMKQYIKARYRRLLIPYIFGILMIVPPQKFLEAVQKNHFSGNYFQFLGQYFSLSRLRFGPSLEFFGYYGHHLWFLGFLMVFSLLFLALYKVFRRGYVARLTDKMISFLCRPGGIYLCFLPLAVAQIILRPLFPDYTDWADTVYWFIFFLYGYLLLSDSRVVEQLARCWKASLVMALSLFFVFVAWMNWGNIIDLESDPSFAALDILYLTLRSLHTWVWIMFIVGVTGKFLHKRTTFLSYTNRAVLPFYILHQTVLLVIGFYVVQWMTADLNKWLVIFLSCFVVTLILYEAVKRFYPTRFLFGMKVKLNKYSKLGG